MDSKNDLGKHLGWLIAYALAAIFFVYVVVNFPTVREVACAPAEEDCFRQWMAAMGGWVAVLAAVPTIYFLSKQIETSTREQRVNFALNIRADTALVRTVKIAAEEAQRQIEHYTSRNQRDGLDQSDRATIVVAQLEMLRDHLQRSAFAEFEVRISPASNVTHRSLVAFVESRLEKARRIATQANGLDSASFSKEFDDICVGFRFADRYIADVLVAITAFEQDVATLQQNFS